MKLSDFPNPFGVVDPIARAVAGTLPSYSVIGFEELREAGLMGYADAMKRHNPSIRGDLLVYLNIRVRGAIFDALRENDPLTRGQRAAVKKAQAEGKQPDVIQPSFIDIKRVRNHSSNRVSIEELIHEKRMLELLRAKLEYLPPRLEKAVRLYYFEDVTLKKIGEEFGVGEARACQIVKEAVNKLKEHMTEVIDVDKDSKNDPQRKGE